MPPTRDTRPTTPASPTTTITCLSVRAPWSHWLIHEHPTIGPKLFENRSQRYRFRGRLFIHSSRWDSPPPAGEAIGEFTAAETASLWRDAHVCPVGAIIGAVDVLCSGDSIDLDEAYDVHAGQSRRKLTPLQHELTTLFPPIGSPAWNWWAGGGALIVGNPQALATPIPTGGKLGLWKLTVDSDRLEFRPIRQNRKRRKRRGGRLDDPGDE